jgi:hypothetical protein
VLPNFIGIGAYRSGTTWLYEVLRLHPEIFMSPEKETNFFSNTYEKGINWYKKFFKNLKNEKIIGEISPSYLDHELAAKRMKEIIPDAKLILSLRNPVEQIISRYFFLVARQMYNKTFEEALDENPDLIEYALYYKHIQRFLRYFSRDQILILIYDDLIIDERAFLKEIYRFMGVNNNFFPPKINEKILTSRYPKIRTIETAVVILSKVLRKFRLYSFVDGLKTLGIDKVIKKWNTKDTKILDRIDLKTRDRLNAIFEEDKKMLSTFIERDLSFWN